MSDSQSGRVFWVIVGLAFLGGAMLASGGYLSNSGEVNETGGVFAAPSGPAVNLSGSYDINLSDAPSSGELTLNTSKGNVTFTSNGRTNATLQANQITGQWTNLTQLDVSQHDLAVNTEDMDTFVVGKDADSISMHKDPTLDDNSVDFVYSGSSGESKVQVQGLTANEYVAATDANSGAALDIAQTNASGWLTLTNLTNSQHTVKLQSVNPDAPNTDNSSASPDGKTIRWSNETVSIAVNDQDFAEASDEVNVTFYLDGSPTTSTNITSNQTVSKQFTGLSEGQHTWHVNASDAYGLSQESATFTFTVDHHDPVVSDPDPTGDIDFSPSELNATINDTDFAKDGDTLDVTIRQNGTKLKTTTLNSNGTVSASIADPPGGTQDWSVAVTDTYGQTTTANFTYSTPDTLYIYNESAPSQLVKNKGTVEVRFFPGGSDDVITRTTTDGTVSLDGLPVSNQMVVKAELSGYHSRRVIIQSIYQQQEIYLLDKSVVTSSDVIFSLNDESGQFDPDESRLVIKKPLTKDFDNDNSDETRYKIIVADDFSSVDEVTATLEQNVRYLLLVKNEDGDTRDVGHYTVTGDASEVIKIGEVRFSLNDDKGWALKGNETWERGYRYIRINFKDQADETSQLEWQLQTRNGTAIASRTISGPLGTYSAAINVSDAANQTFDNETTFVIDYNVTRNGETHSGREYVGDVSDIPVDMDERWLSIIALVATIALTGLVVIVDSGLGAVTAVVTGTFFTIVGFLSLPTGALGLAAVAALLFNIGGRT